MNPDDEANRRKNMTEKTYGIIKTNIMTYINDQNSKTPIRSYKANSDCIKALLGVAHDLLTHDEFFVLCEWIEW